MRFLRFSRMIEGAILALILFFPLTVSTQCPGGTPGNGAPFTGIFAFGDSLTDTGNFFALTGLPPEPYFEGRFSNGVVWVEYLAEGMGLLPNSVVNYAIAGAATGRCNENGIPLSGLQDELDLFEYELGGKSADKRALYVVWAGANDFFVSTSDALDTVDTGVANTLIAVRRLHDAGARRIMVLNLPDLGLTPYARQSDLEDLLSGLSAYYNYSLNSALDGLEAEEGIKTIRVDVAGVLQDAVVNPEDFRFSNVVDAYLNTLGGDPSGFLFWDSLHPTTSGHFFIAEEAMRVLRQEFRHVWGTPKNRR